MKVAVLSLTRDRLDYTKHCFAKLRENAGIPFDHYILDQGSKDGTQEWLFEHAGDFKHVELLGENVGISRALNILLGAAVDHDYDIYVKFDNDCELVTPGTLKEAAEYVAWAEEEGTDLIVSPHIQGLNEPPPYDDDGEGLGFVGQLGGIFMAIPGWVFQEFRYDEQGNPKWGMDDVQLSQWFRNQGGRLAYLLDYPANHYQTTEGQKQTYPEYWERKKGEMGIAA